MIKDNIEPTIESLRKQGYKVKVMHGFVEPDEFYYDIAYHKTTINLRDLNGMEWYGVAKCSKKDQYNRKLGNMIALRRAVKNMNSHYLSESIRDASTFHQPI
jgi:hypothetical protein